MSSGLALNRLRQQHPAPTGLIYGSRASEQPKEQSHSAETPTALVTQGRQP